MSLLFYGAKKSVVFLRWHVMYHAEVVRFTFESHHYELKPEGKIKNIFNTPTLF